MFQVQVHYFTTPDNEVQDDLEAASIDEAKAKARALLPDESLIFVECDGTLSWGVDASIYFDGHPDLLVLVIALDGHGRGNVAGMISSPPERSDSLAK
jgi:hypothetical protein